MGDWMKRLLHRIYSTEHMVADNHIQGELPSTKEAYSDVLRIALPSVVEMVAVSLMASIDTAMVGTIGKSAIAAVGLTTQPRMLMLSIFFALNIGVTAIVARRKGQEKYAEANRTLRNALVMILGLTAVMMVLALSFSKPLIQLVSGEKILQSTIAQADIYFRILAWALPFNALTMCINAAQRGVGNTRTTMYVNIASNLVNVAFNYVLINGHLGFPKLGVKGAAIATAIGFGVGLVLSLISIMGHSKNNGFLRLKLTDDWRLHKETVKAVTKVGGNAMIEQVALRVGFLTYAMIIARQLGEDSFAAHQVCQQVLNITFTFGDGIGVASTSLVGQNLGRERPDLSMMYGKIAQRIALTVSTVLLFIIIVFRAPIVGFFIDGTKDLNVFNLAVQVMFVVAIFQPFQTSSVVISGCLRGAGDNRYVALVMLICVVLIRPICTLLAINVLQIGLVGAWLSSLIDMFIRLGLVYRRFASGKWFALKV